MNPFLITDGYKTGHHKMYPEGTTLVYSNFTPRHGKHSNTKLGGVISFGQQMVMRQIKELFDDGFFKRTQRNELRKSGLLEEKRLDSLKTPICQEIKKEYSLYLGTDYDVSHIEALWDLGYLPIKVKALPEGTFVPYGVPVLTIVNTKPEFFWLTNFLETMISNMLWMPMTAATTAYSYKQILTDAALKTDKDKVGFVDFQGHNFGMRGMGGLDATIYSGLGHDTSFKGDDSLPSIFAARKFYDEDGFVVGSVNATEHSVMCSGTKDDEIGTFRYLMKQFPTGILSIVSDTWDLWKVLTEYLPELKDEILARDGKIVIRPDSGDPVDIICGEGLRSSNHPEIDSQSPNISWKNVEKLPKEKGVIELLWDLFGGTTNEQGYKVLDPHIGAIYGDSITLERAKQITERLEANGFASTNVVLGIGSYSYQYVTRDTHGFAMKATYVEVEDKVDTYTKDEAMDFLSAQGVGAATNEMLSEFFSKTVIPGKYVKYSDLDDVEIPTTGREIFKDPITSDGSKKSAKGLLQVFNNNHNCNGYDLLYDGNDELILNDQVDWDKEAGGLLQVIFEDGKFSNNTTLTEIRERINKLIQNESK